jgi:hypothetical protein
MKILRVVAAPLIGAIVLLTGCSNPLQVGPAEVDDQPTAVELVEELEQQSGIQFGVLGVELSCSRQQVVAWLYGVNLGVEELSYRSGDFDTRPWPIDVTLRNANGMGYWDSTMLVSDGEIPSGEQGRIAVAFGRFTSDELRFNKVDVIVNGEVVF